MKKLTVILLLGVVLTGGIAGLAAATANNTATGYDWCPGYRWINSQNESSVPPCGPGYGAGMGNGPGQGYGAATGTCLYYDTETGAALTTEIPEPTVDTEAKALEIAKEAFNTEVSEDDIYQKGRWWIVYYTDGETLKQGRIDAFSGEVIEEFYPRGRQAGQGRGQYGQGRGYCGGRFA